MKYTISYARKESVQKDGAYSSVEIGLHKEFDETTPTEEAYGLVRNQVEKWLQDEKNRIQSERSTVAPEQTQKPEPKPLTIEDVSKAFPADLSGIVYFEDEGESILVKPRQFLETETFRKIADIVKDQLGGEYISLGKGSHFRVSKAGKKK